VKSSNTKPLNIIPFVITIALAAGFLLCGYEFIRSPSSSIYLEAYGKENLPYAMLGGALFTIIFIYIYGWLITLIGARRTLLVTSIFSAVMISACYFGVQGGSRISAWFLYSFREAYIVVVIEQYWSLINSVLRENQAKKFNGPITGVGSLGAIVGGFTVAFIVAKVHTEGLVLLASASLLPSALFSELAYRFGGEPAPSVEEKGKKSLAIKLFRDSSYLRRIAILIFLTQIISTVLDLRFSGLVLDAFPIKDGRTAFFGTFYGRLNLIAGVLQFIVTPILLSFVRFKYIHPTIPIIHLATAAILLIKPSLFTGGLAFLVFKALDYSIFRAGKEIFYMPLSFDSRYRAKEVIDAFGYRASKGISAGFTSLATLISGFFGYVLLAFYPITAAISAILWLATVTGVVRQHDKMVKKIDQS
jgi:AAA family ATP:ADP antiporter